ncbi:MAG: LemA family protein [Candidatus Micrarchaeota archaeon]|nr:LemA family protein [Candidatus Micrarchaeota archaeon]
MVLELVILVVVALVVLYAILTYNGLVGLRLRVENAWAQIDVQLKRRYDLIPNLIETVKGYMKHEKETLTQITKYRAQLVTGSVEDKATANNMLSQSLKSIFAVSENYPQLKANENFTALQEELAGTENKISYARTAYNDNVMAYNTSIQTFPSNIIASMLAFVKKPFFETAEAERENVKVKF